MPDTNTQIADLETEIKDLTLELNLRDFLLQQQIDSLRKQIELLAMAHRDNFHPVLDQTPPVPTDY